MSDNVLKKTQSLRLPPRIRNAILIPIGIVAFAYISMLGYDWFVPKKADAPVSQQQQAGTSKTAFNGVDTNSGDPLAGKTYCKDLGDYAKSIDDRSKLKDICVLESIANDWLPTMTDEQMADMAKNDPGCFETGFGKDGFNCFTGFDKNECGRDGVSKDGKECVPVTAKDSSVLAMDPAKICDLVSGCLDKAKFNNLGVNEFGCNRQGRMEDGSICPLEYLTPIYGADNRDQLGFTPEGFNKNNCDQKGFRKDGSACPLDEVTRVYGRDKKDQYGFFENGLNEAGCNIHGLAKGGRVCKPEDITRVYVDGKDQFGISKAGFNENNCNLAGFKPDGAACDLADMPRIFGTDGLDQNGLRRNGRNEFHCDLSGKKPDGTVCAMEETPLIFDAATGKNQFGVFKDGRNEFGCDIHHRKANGSLCAQSERVVGNTLNPSERPGGVDELDSSGRNKFGCNVDGFDANGNRCALHHIPRVYNAGVDQFGVSSDGFNDKGCSLEGLRRDGSVCPLEDIPRVKDANKVDQFGFGEPPYNAAGCDFNGLKADGTRCDWKDVTKIPGLNGVTQFGVLENGIDPATGCDISTGRRLDGSWCKYDDIKKWRDGAGLDQFALDSERRNEHGCNPEGRKKDGSLCSPTEVPVLPGAEGYTPDHKTIDGTSRTGFKNGYNEFGCDVNGMKADGSLCPLEQITRVYSAGVDQFGIKSDGTNAKGCLLSGLKPDGTACNIEDIPLLRGKDGKTQFDKDPALLSAFLKAAAPLVDANGNPVLVNGRAVKVGPDGTLFDAKTGQPIRDANGELMRVSADGKIETASGGTPKAVVTSAGQTPLLGDAFSGAGLSGLVNDKGEPLTIGGKPVGVNGKGEIVDLETGKVVLGADGKPLKMSADGTVVDSNGNPVELTTVNGKPHRGAAYVSAPSGLLVGPSGEPALINDRAVFTAPDGTVRYADTGELVRDPKTGEPLFLSPNGDLVTKDGNVSSLDPAGKLSVSTSAPGVLMGKDGPVLVDGKVVGVDANKRVVDLVTGKPVTDKKGEPLLLVDGKIQTKSGKKPAASIATISEKGAPVINGKNRPAQQVVNEGRDAGGVTALMNGAANEKGCLITGLKVDGSRCALSDVPRVRTADGADQFGVFENGRNAFGCGFDGKREDGSQCPLDQTPRIFGADKLDQFGIGPDGRNIHGCDLNHKKTDGSLCKPEEQIQLFDVAESDINRLDDEGYNPKGCSVSGFRRDGTRCDLVDIPRIFKDGYDQFSLDVSGRNKAGCDLTGKKPDGSLCPIADIPLILHPDTKEDQFGMINGRNKFGCDLYGYKENGVLCPSEQRTRIFSNDLVDQFGVKKTTGLNGHGCNEQNLDAHGRVCKPEQTIRFLNAEGVDQDGFDKNLKNGFDCDINGKKPDGTACKPEEVTRVLLDKVRGKDQFDLDYVTGLNESGCGVDGLDANGKPCDHAKIPLLIGANGEDQFGINKKTKVNKNGCSILGVRADGSSCDPKEAPVIMGKDGFSQLNYDRNFYNREGYAFNGLDLNGCDSNNNSADNAPCAKYRPLALDHADNAYIDERKAIVSKLITQHINDTKYTANTDKGTYDFAAIKAAESAAIAQRKAENQAIASTQSAEKAADAAQNPTGADGVPEIPVGLMLIVEVQTPVNSDYTQDVYGKIVGSELDGQVVKGTIDIPFLDNVVMPRDKFRYTFKELIYNRKSYPIDAISINLDNDSGMVSADDVEYHRWQRYSGLLVASAVQALDASFLDSQEERALREQAALIGQAQTSQLYAQNTEALTKQNLKTATSYVSGIAKEQFFRRPTIKKAGFTHQLIVFRTEVDNAKLPMVFSEEDY